jgi:hypothetical protein
LSNTPTAFEDNAQEFNDYLSSLFTETITAHPLQPILRPNIAYITFEGARSFRDSPSVELDNGCRIRISQTILPNPEVPSGVTTKKYVYAYALGADPRRDWLVRYDYAPDALTNHPAAHVHFNGISDTYNSFLNAEEKPLRDVHFPTDRITVEDFIEHLVREYDVPTHRGKKAALRFLAERRREFHEQHRTRRAPYDVLE